MKTPTKLPYGHPSTLRKGPFHCKGSLFTNGNPPSSRYTIEQAAWMLVNKPLYFTGTMSADVHHLPQEMRSL